VRIGFECSTIAPGRSGIGYYAERLLHALGAELSPGDELWALTMGDAPAGARAAPRFHPRAYKTLWMNVAVPRVARALKLDLYHFTNNVGPLRFGPPYVVTIHDLSTRLLPETHPLRRRLMHSLHLVPTARHARRVITSSNGSAKDIVDLLGVPRERIDVIPLAADAQFRPVEDVDLLARARRRYRLDGPFVLYVGNIEPRKNLVRLVEAFARVRAPGVTLALAGGLAWMSQSTTERIRALGLEHRVRLLGYVPDEDLPALYSAAEVFAYPSLLEGFGLPVLEAMACGTPVITSTAASLVEIADGAARLVDPHSIGDIARALADLLASGDERARLAAAGLARARQYSWEETARRTLDSYRRALA
jgi:glycosyltransferase involved in cell wall biosynthesis